MANTYVNIDMAVRKTSVVLENSMKFGKRATRRFDDKFGIEGAKIGESLRVPIPPRFIAYKQEALGSQDSTETFRTLTLQYAHVPLRNFSLNDIKLRQNDFTERILRPAAITLANLIDLDGTELYKSVFNRVGTVGSAGPSDLDTYLLAWAKMMEEGAPDDGDWTMCINPEMNRKIVDALKGLFVPGSQLGPQYEKGRMDMRNAAGWNW
ncbi:MAG: P22 phage major capsid protein family protein, partial [bacterium]|nr:P22 phage major capsid protein family protein [bacterium]